MLGVEPDLDSLSFALCPSPTALNEKIKNKQKTKKKLWILTLRGASDNTDAPNSMESWTWQLSLLMLHPMKNVIELES